MFRNYTRKRSAECLVIFNTLPRGSQNGRAAAERTSRIVMFLGGLKAGADSRTQVHVHRPSFPSKDVHSLHIIGRMESDLLARTVDSYTHRKFLSKPRWKASSTRSWGRDTASHQYPQHGGPDDRPGCCSRSWPNGTRYGCPKLLLLVSALTLSTYRKFTHQDRLAAST